MKCSGREKAFSAASLSHSAQMRGKSGKRRFFGQKILTWRWLRKTGGEMEIGCIAAINTLNRIAGIGRTTCSLAGWRPENSQIGSLKTSAPLTRQKSRRFPLRPCHMHITRTLSMPRFALPFASQILTEIPAHQQGHLLPSSCRAGLRLARNKQHSAAGVSTAAMRHQSLMAVASRMMAQN